MPDKVDIHLEISDTAHDVESSIKAGQVVLLKVDDESSALVCCTNSGTQLGAVPATYRDRIKRPAEAHATIRSVKRQADKVTDILVRVVLGSPASVSVAPAQHTDRDIPEDPSGYAVTVAQLTNLASNEDMAITLKDERLQQRILEIDNAPNREQALKIALQEGDFRQFADQVLGLLHPAAGE
eukprot:jgi/Chrzof1/11045/Cz05g21170.t1